MLTYVEVTVTLHFGTSLFATYSSVFILYYYFIKSNYTLFYLHVCNSEQNHKLTKQFNKSHV